MTAFLTGSRVYGTPTNKSDTDLCVFVTPAALEVLRKLAGLAGLGRGAGAVAKSADGGSLSNRDLAEDPGDSLYFDGLNLICHTNPHAFAAWKATTVMLEARKPVTRDEACREIKAAVKQALELAQKAGAA